MKIIENDGLKLLKPESEDFVLYNTKLNMYHEQVYLGKLDTVDNYREIHKSLQPGYDKDKDLKSIVDSQEQAIAALTEQLTKLMNQIDPKDI